jgi:hypothetical protein
MLCLIRSRAHVLELARLLQLLDSLLVDDKVP